MNKLHFLLAAYKNGDELARPTEKHELLDVIRSQQSAAECEDYREGVIREYLADKDRTCVLELWYDALGNGFSKPSKKDSNDIGAILVNHLGWSRGSVINFGESRDGKLVGWQKSFTRNGIKETAEDATELPF